MLEANQPKELDDLATEFVNRLRTGESVSIAQFAAQYPENSDAITQLFPAIQSIESLRKAKDLSAVQASPAPIAFQQLGDFRIVKEIGRGGMGIVFLAEQVSLGRRIALKVLPPSYVADPKYAKRFQREARIAANLHHTNIVPVFGVGQEKETLYIAMQYIQGVGLDQLIEAAKKELADDEPPTRFRLEATFSQLMDRNAAQEDSDENPANGSCFDNSLSRSVAQIGLQAATALQFAHEQGVLHRDVTPSNLLLDQNGKAWVADFGLACAVQFENITETGAVMGTLKYMAPEQYCRDGDARSDVYSLGLTLFELATLKPARNAKQFFQRIAENRSPAALPRVRKLNPMIDRDLESIITRAIETNPEQRYSSAEQMATDLELYLNGEPLRTQSPSPVRKAARWAKRNPFAASVSGLALLLMVAITVLSASGYFRELNHRNQNEALARIATDALDEIYAQLAPRNLPQDLPAIRAGTSPVSSFDVVQMPSDEMFAVLEKLQSHYERVSEFSYDTSIKLKAADAKNRIGQINIYLGKLAAAERAFLDAAQMCVEIIGVRTTGSDQVQDDARVLLASTWNQLGYVYRGQFNDALATDAHDRAFEYLENPSGELASNSSYRFELARTLYSQDIYAHDDCTDPSCPSRTEQALEILNQLEQTEVMDSEIQLLQARCYRRLSEKISSLPNLNDTESIRIMRELVEQYPEIPQYKFELGYCLTGDQFYEIHEAKDYYKRIQEALSIAEELMQTSPNVPRYTQLAVLANEKHANYFRATNNPLRAAAYTDSAIGHQKSLLKRFPQLVPQHRVFLYALRLEATNLMVEQNELKQARVELEEITKSVEELIVNPKLENDWHALRVLTSAFDSLARIAERQKDTSRAMIDRVKADHYRERMYKVSM